MKVFAVLVLFALIGGVYLYRERTVPPDCANQLTTDLIKKILVEQFKYPPGIEIANVRTVQGGLFSHRFECDATVEGDLSDQSFLGMEMRAVHYTSEVTEDTHRQYVTAKPLPLVKSSQ